MPQEIVLRFGATSAHIAPWRGGLVTAFRALDHDFLYLDQSTLYNLELKVRGGIPFLFPNAGPLAYGILETTQTSLPQHGFARNRPWIVVDRSEDEVILELPIDPEIRDQYPYSFRLRLLVSVAANVLRIEARIENLDQKALPVACGWHPYIFVPHTLKSAMRSRLLTSNSLQVTDDVEVNAGLPFAGYCDIAVAGQPSLVLRASKGHKHLQIWSLPRRDFVCFEPFVGPPDTLNQIQNRLNVPPGANASLWIELEAHAASGF